MKKTLIVFCMSLAVLMACSESDSNGGVTQPSSGTITPNASKCDLATQKLPASSLAWQTTFGGGCEVTQQFALNELEKFDTLLIAAGYQKKELTQGTYRYVLETLNVETTSSTNDTLEFSYLQGTFAGFFRSATNQITKQALKIALTTQACPVLIPESLFGKQVCGKADNLGTITVASFYYTPKDEAKLASDLNSSGWICNVASASSYTCTANYGGNSYSLRFEYGLTTQSVPGGTTIVEMAQIKNFTFNADL